MVKKSESAFLAFTAKLAFTADENADEIIKKIDTLLSNAQVAAEQFEKDNQDDAQFIRNGINKACIKDIKNWHKLRKQNQRIEFRKYST